MTKRREFIKKSSSGMAGVAVGGIGLNTASYASKIGPKAPIKEAGRKSKKTHATHHLLSIRQPKRGR